MGCWRMGPEIIYTGEGKDLGEKKMKKEYMLVGRWHERGHEIAHSEATKDTIIGQFALTMRPINGDSEDDNDYICYVKLDGLNVEEIEEKMELVFLKLAADPTIVVVHPMYLVESPSIDILDAIVELKRNDC